MKLILIFKKKVNTLTFLVIYVAKSLQIGLNSINLLLLLRRLKVAILNWPIPMADSDGLDELVTFFSGIGIF